MTLSGATLISLLFIVLGVALIKKRQAVGKKAAIWYKKLGIEVPEELYIKQFTFVGIMLVIVGFLGATGLLAYL